MENRAVLSRDGTGVTDPAQRYLGAQLRRLRETCGITREAAAQSLRCTEPKISRLEMGTSRVKDTDLDLLLTLYKVTSHAEREAMLTLARRLTQWQWWHNYRDVVPEWLRSYFVLESITETVRTYEPRFIPGLLQTRAYAHALMGNHYPEREAVRRVNVRLQRRQTLLEQGRRRKATNTFTQPWLWAIIDESALSERIGAPEVMREQLDFLVDVAADLSVQIQILPSGNGGLTGLANPFSLFRLPTPALPDLVYIEHLTGAIFVDDPADVETYRRAMERLVLGARPLADTATQIREAIESLGPAS
jgi:transcriptional regulator with XRE-family HTH domain